MIGIGERNSAIGSIRSAWQPYMTPRGADNPIWVPKDGIFILLGDTMVYDESTVAHPIEWRRDKIDRKVSSTLAAEGNSAANAYDKGM